MKYLKYEDLLEIEEKAKAGRSLGSCFVVTLCKALIEAWAALAKISVEEFSGSCRAHARAALPEDYTPQEGS